MTTELFVAGAHCAGHAAYKIRLVGEGVNPQLSTEGATYTIIMPDGETFLPPLTNDGFMFAVLLEAMMIGQPMHVQGAISARALKNAALFCEAWHNLLPDTYTPINITADAILSDREAISAIDDRAISAFSGGIDAIFTALRHKNRDLNAGSHDLTGVVMVHGLDVPFDDDRGFLRLQTRVAPVLDMLGLSRASVWTNFRSMTRQLWGMGFCAQLSACLHLFSGKYRYALVGSSEPYSDLILPWGSNPATDYLLSGGAMDIVHDGAGYSRTEKVKRVAANSIATRYAKFCWEGEPQKNCGVCEKCIRTRLNFLAAADLENPSCFEQPFDLSLVDQLSITSPAIYTEFKTILDYALKHARSGAWVDALRRLLERNSGNFIPKSAM